MKMQNQMPKRKEINLGEGNVGKLMFRLALPAITAQIINLLYNLVDRMYIGHLKGIGAAALDGCGGYVARKQSSAASGHFRLCISFQCRRRGQGLDHDGKKEE